MIQTAPSNDFWSDVIIAAAGDDEVFDDVRVLTLRNYWSGLVLDKVYARTGRLDYSEATLETALGVINEAPIPACEHVVIDSNGITVVLDVDAVDDDAIFKSMWALSQALDTLDGGYGTVPLGSNRVMSFADFVL